MDLVLWSRPKFGQMGGVQNQKFCGRHIYTWPLTIIKLNIISIFALFGERLGALFFNLSRDPMTYNPVQRTIMGQ